MPESVIIPPPQFTAEQIAICQQIHLGNITIDTITPEQLLALGYYPPDDTRYRAHSWADVLNLVNVVLGL